LPPTGENAEQLRPKFESLLKDIDPAARITKLEVVGPQVGDELRYAAIVSLSVTLVLIGLYIVLRFHTWRLSLGAIFAVMHDPILVLGVFSITQTPFDLAVVAAILAVVGYSLNDTIVVFDRIRENFEKNRRQEPSITLDQAINQTLSRTIMTKFTTSIVIVALLILGGSALRGFSEALLIGIVAGTYSSIYISAAIALSCGLKAEHVFPTVKKDPIDELP
jgi:preprotein translocase subunit SecF